MMNQENFKMVRDCLSQRGKVPVHVLSSGRPTEEEIRMLFDERITPETELPPMEPLFRIFDTPCFYRGELVADCGKAKSGKTTFLSVLMAAGCLPQNLQKEVSIPLQRVRGDPLRILWIDTEQSQQSTQEILRDRIGRMNEGITNPDIQADELQIRQNSLNGQSGIANTNIQADELQIRQNGSEA
jgi:hypothetical protein